MNVPVSEKSEARLGLGEDSNGKGVDSERENSRAPERLGILQKAPLSLDFTNSFIYWWMDSLNHSPRCALRARCIVETESRTETFYLTHACAAENMYVERNLIQQPSAEFHLIFNDSEEILTVKFFDRGSDCNRSAVRVGESFQANVNRGCAITRLERNFRFFSAVERLESNKAVYEAMMNHLPIIGRTIFRLPYEGGTATVTAEYPVTVMNAHHDTHNFQVDTGLILLPDGEPDGDLGIMTMREAFIVYNSFDFAEYILRTSVKISAGGDEGNHFSTANRIECRNELFAATAI